MNDSNIVWETLIGIQKGRT